MNQSTFSPHILEIQALECLLAIGQTASFSKAAERVHKTQSAVSQKIAKLEDLLKCKLIDRENKNRLTEQGELLYRYANKILALHQEAISHFLAPNIRGEIKFALPEDFATVFLAEILAEFKTSFPNVLVNVECDLTMNILKRFHKKQFDIVLVKSVDREDFPDEIELWEVPLVWVAKKQTAINLNQAIPLVLSPKPCIYRASALNALEDAGHRYKVTYSSPSFIGATAAVKADMGLTVLPQNMIPAGLEQIKHPALPRLANVHVSFLIKEGSPSSVHAFAEYLLSKLRRKN